MSISNTKREAAQAAAFRCGYCGYSAELPIGAIGKKAKCPECGEVTRVLTAIDGASESRPEGKADRAAMFSCDFCDYATELPAETVGKKAKCPECGELSRVRSAEPQLVTEVLTDDKTVPLRQESADVDSLAMSYLGRATQLERARKDTIPLAPETRQHCPHCHQLLPVKTAAPKPARGDSDKPSGAPAKPPAAPAQAAPRPSPLPPSAHTSPSGSRSSSPSAGKPAADPVMRCPFCREVILLAARKCKHCGEYLDDSLRCLSEPNNNKNRRDNSSRSAPERTEFTLMQDLWYRVGPGKLVVAVLVVAGLGWAAMHFLGPKSGVPATPVAAVDGGGAGADDKASAAKTALDKLTRQLQKQLQGTSIRSSGGSTLSFETNDKGLVPWDCELVGSGKSLKGRLTIPFKLESSESFLASGRGRYVLEFSSKSDGKWELRTVIKETRTMIKGGAETDIPEDDRPSMRQQDGDFAVVHFKKTLAKLAPGPTDD